MDTLVDGASTLSREDLRARFDALTLQSTRLDAERLACLREIDARDIPGEDGHQSTATWVAFRYGWSRRTASREIRLTRQLASMPATERALDSGAITVDHAQRLAKARTARTEAHFDIDEAQLVQHACDLSFTGFCNITKYWEQHADPDGAADAAERTVEARNLSMLRVGDQWLLNGTSDAVSGAEIAEALHRIEQELFDNDWAEARERVGDDVCLDDLSRTNAQRRHDSLLEMARRAGSTKPGAKAPEPLAIVVMDYDTYVTEGLRHAGIELDFASDTVYSDVISRLIDGTPIDPATAFEVAIRGQLSRIVMQGKSTIIDAGTSTRFFTGALRKALIVRDPVCSWPGCEAPSIHAEVDHIVDYADGGATSARNGQPYCRFHHAKKHPSEFTVYLDHDDTRRHDRADGTPIQPLLRAPP